MKTHLHESYRRVFDVKKMLLSASHREKSLRGPAVRYDRNGVLGIAREQFSMWERR